MKTRLFAILAIASTLATLGAQSANAVVGVPLSQSMFTGILESGSILNLPFSDNNRMNLRSTFLANGSSRIDTAINHSNPTWLAFSSPVISLKLEARRSVSGPVSIYLYHWQQDRYVFHNAIGFGTNDTVRQGVLTSNGRAYVGPGGQVIVRLVSAGSSHRFQIDQMLVDVSP
ncbi:MAG TPA: hypothetical protein PLH94_07595 [Fimbriimonadaceae bacterium]|nr:hypothetical protein [Fimbriimonadaceae bacterium]